ncbi:MAG: ABC transporter ATP-binding protein [Bryobacterales bacterium]|nr:ABC transporter ATP-binding protein [Bryobacterales bacterium]
MSFSANHLGFTYGLAEATFELPSTGLIAVVGPNGAGKSTLVSILAGLRRAYSGSCLYAGKEVRDWRRHGFARQVAFLPQFVRVEFPFTAEQVVFMGRTPHSNGWYDSPEDRIAVDRALEITDAAAFRNRDFRSLSGGERQRVILASALAQEPQVLLLDEPATFLDLKHQAAMYQLLARLARQLLVVAVTHDLNLALRYAHHVLVLDQGRLAAAGAANEVLTTELIARVFQVRATIERGWLKVEYDA